MHSSTPSPRTPVLALAAPLGALLLVACPGDDTGQDPDPTEGTGTGTGATLTDGPDPDTTTTTTTVDPTTTSGTTTEDVDDTGPVPDDTTGEPPPPDGTCVALELVGYADSVLSRDGMPIDATCTPAPAPCGGDVVGVWALEGSCGYEAIPNPLEDQCPGSTFMIEIISESGTMAFEDDGTWVQDLDIETQVVLSLDPMACFGVACAVFEGLVQMNDPAATCEAMGSTCTCTFPDDGSSEVIMGTYVVVGNDLVLTVGDDTGTYPFCVDGDRFDLWQPLYIAPVVDDVSCADEQDCVEAFGDAFDAYVCVADER